MTAYEVQNGNTVYHLDGELLAEKSSQRPGAPRWMELKLYKTVNGQYVLHKIGESRMLHAPTCEVPTDQIGNRPKLPRFQEVFPGKDPYNSNEFWWCEVCEGVAESDFPSLEIEQARHHMTMSEDPADIIDALYRRKGGAKSMPKLSMQLLEEAGERDYPLAVAFQSSFVL